MAHNYETIKFKAKEDVYGLLQGGEFSKLLGVGYDFAELRAYTYADDIRHISWINSAKLGEPYVKKMHEERELNVVVVSLIDGRMVIGNKVKNMAYLMALLGYSALLSNNRLQTVLFLGEELSVTSSSKSLYGVDNALNKIEEFSPLAKRVPYQEVQKVLLKQIESKSLIFILGDFLESIELSTLAQKHEVYAVVIRDRWEENPTLSLDAELIDPLTNRFIKRVPTKKALDYYAKQCRKHDLKLFERFAKERIGYTKIYEEYEALEKLERLFYN